MLTIPCQVEREGSSSVIDFVLTMLTMPRQVERCGALRGETRRLSRGKDDVLRLVVVEKMGSDFDVAPDKEVPYYCLFSILVAAASELALLL